MHNISIKVIAYTIYFTNTDVELPLVIFKSIRSQMNQCHLAPINHCEPFLQHFALIVCAWCVHTSALCQPSLGGHADLIYAFDSVCHRNIWALIYGEWHFNEDDPFITCGLSGYACVGVVFVQPKIEHIVLTCLSPVIAVSWKTALPFCLLLNVFLFNYFLCEIIMSHQRVT